MNETKRFSHTLSKSFLHFCHFAYGGFLRHTAATKWKRNTPKRKENHEIKIKCGISKNTKRNIMKNDGKLFAWMQANILLHSHLDLRLHSRAHHVKPCKNSIFFRISLYIYFVLFYLFERIAFKTHLKWCAFSVFRAANCHTQKQCKNHTKPFHSQTGKKSK